MSTTIDPDFAEPSVPQTPERKLWATCLLNGIHEAFEARRQRIQRKGATMNFDEAWLFDPEPNHVGSFNWICHQLGMEPELLRERSLRNLPQDVPLDRRAKPMLFEKDEGHRALRRHVLASLVHPLQQRAADALKVGRTTMQRWFAELRAERRVTTFIHNRRRYYTLTRAEITRRKLLAKHGKEKSK